MTSTVNSQTPTHLQLLNVKRKAQEVDEYLYVARANQFVQSMGLLLSS